MTPEHVAYHLLECDQETHPVIECPRTIELGDTSIALPANASDRTKVENYMIKKQQEWQEHPKYQPFAVITACPACAGSLQRTKAGSIEVLK